MSSLFIDTTYNQKIGLLSSEGAWLFQKQLEGQKSSAQLHMALHELSQNQKLNLKDVKNIIYLAGPGFYTGLRIAYGLADILRFESIKPVSFYSFMIPKMLGTMVYSWVTKAYRGEVFVYTFKNGEEDFHLLKEADFMKFSCVGEIFVHHESALDELIKSKLQSFQSTETILQENIQKISQLVIDSNSEEDLYYFRTPEEEFKPSV